MAGTGDHHQVKDVTPSVTEIQKNYGQALDDLVNVNSLFTAAVFIGFSFSTPGQTSLDGREKCNASTFMLKVLVLLEVASFSFFLYSSLMAKALKLEFTLEKAIQTKGSTTSLKSYARMMLISTVWASLFGFLCLTLSIILAIQVKLGKLSCKNGFTTFGISFMCVVLSPVVVAYLSYAIYASRKDPRKGHSLLELIFSPHEVLAP
ncbi:unnamed protein product [Ilex paraguariensis]|uniref:PGG domain-containing protein n=1 Tax=Ilex paraguariensis TaxID=185542 RepID=A0ABC8R704_9AQUA